jgi:hypothetical protein
MIGRPPLRAVFWTVAALCWVPLHPVSTAQVAALTFMLALWVIFGISWLIPKGVHVGLRAYESVMLYRYCRRLGLTFADYRSIVTKHLDG